MAQHANAWPNFFRAARFLPAVEYVQANRVRTLLMREVAAALGAHPGQDLERPGAVGVLGPGTGDNMGAALGLGLAPGTPVVSLGTSGTAYAVSTIRTADPTGAVADSSMPLNMSRWVGESRASMLVSIPKTVCQMPSPTPPTANTANPTTASS